MATTYELKIRGKIQHVGFRNKIENLGHALDIDGVVYNYKDETVRILANLDDEELKGFFKKSIKYLEKKDDLIEIDEIEEKELNAYIDFPKGINRISADDLLELNKKLDDGVKYIKLIFGELTEQKIILIEHREILTNINIGIKDVKSEINTGLNDVKSEINTGLNDVKSEINTGLNDVKSEMGKLNKNMLELIHILKNK